MQFNSTQYALFLPVVLFVYWRLAHRGRLLVLLVASYFFYGWWDWRFLFLIALSTVVDFGVARVMGRTDDERRRLQLLLVSLAVNLGILGTFKYFEFFTDSATEFFRAIGLDAGLPTLEILLPVGISFYTFQTISYTFDVYRRRIEPTDDLLTFAVFVSFFPQLVAGPIERARHLLPQFQSPRAAPDRAAVASALYLIVQGLFKKVVIADGLASFSNTAFEANDTAGWVTLLVGVWAFTIQIYGDFSGYTDIARGSSRLLGVELMENFRQPYLSRTISEHWRTWHISLSSWLRDYLYVPLGGNRRGRLATYRNLMITMVLGGLWHGAAWTFVFWGALHGLFLAAHRAMGAGDLGGEEPLRWRDAPRVIATFHLSVFAFIFFRSRTFGDALDFLGGIATLRSGPVEVDGLLTLAFFVVLVVALDLAQRWRDDELAVLHFPPVPQGVALGVLLLGILIWSGGTPSPFIYFQF